MRERWGRGCLAVGTLLCLAGVPLVVFPGLRVAWKWLPLWLVMGEANAADLPKYVVLRLGAALCVLGATLLPSRLQIPAVRSWIAGGVAFVAWYGLSAAMSANPAWSLPAVLNLLALAAAAAAWISAATPSDFAAGARLLVGTSLLVGIYSILQHQHLDIMDWDNPEYSVQQTIATLGNPDFLAHFEATMLPLGAALAMTAGPRAVCLGAGGAVVALLVSLGYTQVRGAALALLAAGLIVAVRGWRDRRLWGRRAYGAAGLALAVAIVCAHTLLQRPVDVGEKNAAARIYLWKVAGRLVAAHPLVGVGPDSFPYASLAHRDLEPMEIRGRLRIPEDPHNVFLSVAAASGLPAVLLLGAFLGRLARSWARARRDCSVEETIWDLGLGASLAIFWMEGVFIYPTPGPSVVAAFVTARLIVQLLPAPEPMSTPRGRWLAPIGLALVLAAAWTGGSLLRADFLHQAAVRHGEVAVSDANDLSFQRGASLQLFDEALSLARYSLPQAADIELHRGKMLESWFDQSRLADVAAQAVGAYQDAIRMNPRNPFPWMDLARMLDLLGQSLGEPYESQALQAQEEALRLDPYNAIFRGDHGILEARLHQYPQAERDLLRSLEIYPQNVAVWTALAQTYADRERWREAGDAVAKAREIDPHYAPARRLQEVVRAHLRSGDTPGGVE